MTIDDLDLRAFEHQVESLQREYSTSNVTTCIDLLFKPLQMTLLSGCDIFLLIHSRRNSRDLAFYPSLSIYKPANTDPTILHNISEAYALLKEHCSLSIPFGREANSLQNFINNAIAAGYSRIRNKSLPVTILARDINRAQRRALQLLIPLAHHISHRSLNLLNEHYDRLLDDQHAFLQFLEKASNSWPPSPLIAASTLCVFIKKKYKLVAQSITYNSQMRSIDTDRYTEDTIHAAILNDNKNKLDYLKPMSGIARGQFYIIQPFTNRRRPSRFQHVIVVTSRKLFPAHIATNIQAFTDYYFNECIDKARTLTHVRMQRDTIMLYDTAVRSIRNPSQFNYIASLKTFVSPALESALTTTNAFSATLRLYNPATESLDLHLEVMEKGVEKLVEGTLARSIPLSIRKSVNARTFSGDAQSYTYIPDVSDSRWHDKVLHHRKYSRCELCFPLLFKSVRIGVLNFESQVVRGFPQDDIEFLRSLKHAIENYVVLLLEFNDKHWLARRPQLYQNLHELAVLIESPSFPNNMRDTMRQYLGTSMRVELSDAPTWLSHLASFYQEYTNNWRDEMTAYLQSSAFASTCVDNFKNACSVKLHPITIRSDRLSIIKVIVKNLLDNFREHCNPKTDRLSVRQTRSKLQLRVDSDTPVDESLRDNYLICPIEKNEDPPSKDRRLHYGLFIIGMLAQQLSGFAWLGTTKEGKCRILVTVPLEE